MAAPVVQSVEQIIADLNPAYKESIDVVNKRRAALPGQFQAQRSGLEAEKVQGFNQINNQATGRGMSFSGIPLDEQANYLSTKYLPGMQQLAFQENEQNLALDEALAGINKERRLRAMDTRQQQQSALEKYLAEERQRAWEREQFQAQQAMERAKMAQQASIAAADRRANTPAAPTKYTWTKNAAGGYDVSGGADLATAVASQGGSITNLVSLLMQGSDSDKKAAQKYLTDKNYGQSGLMRDTGAFYKGGGW